MPFYYKIFLAYSIFIKPFYWASYALKAINKFFNDLGSYLTGDFYFCLGLSCDC